jgi:hypothetical protein
LGLAGCGGSVMRKNFIGSRAVEAQRGANERDIRIR